MGNRNDGTGDLMRVSLRDKDKKYGSHQAYLLIFSYYMVIFFL